MLPKKIIDIFMLSLLNL